MIPFHPQHVTDENGRRTAVLLPAAEWEKVLEELEELDDIREYDKAKSGPQDSVPLDQAVSEGRS